MFRTLLALIHSTSPAGATLAGDGALTPRSDAHGAPGDDYPTRLTRDHCAAQCEWHCYCPGRMGERARVSGRHPATWPRPAVTKVD
jgi:hypothetical protein